jgi:hypothetical protein
MTGVGCGSDDRVTPDHSVYFVGNVYDGATGQRLAMAALSEISIQYRDKTIKVSIDAEGRFVSTNPLPTWQDYTVTIEAAGYRPFVSRNPGFEVPASLAAMSSGLAEISTTQTFTFDAYLFPTSVKSPAATMAVNLIDDATGLPVVGKAAGSVRFRPTAVSAVQVGAKDTAGGAPRASRRVWLNDEDLLAKTVTKAFSEGKVALAEGELSYGVVYELSIFDVDGYAPYVTDGAASPHYAAGAVTTRSIQLPRGTRDPLRLLSSSACALPVPTDTTPGAKLTLTFSENIELVGTTYPEDIDDGVAVLTNGTCPLKLDVDPTKQERGTKVEVAGATLTFSFTPSAGLSDSMGGTVCTPATVISAVSYSNLSKVLVQPVGDVLRKVSLPSLLSQLNPTAVSTTLSCPALPAP